MDETQCFRHKNEKANKEKLVPSSDLPGIPSAPVRRRKARYAEKDYLERKLRLRHKLPIYTVKEIQMLGQPYHVLILSTLVENGYPGVLKEINTILDKENHEIYVERKYDGLIPLISLQETFTLIVDTLKFCKDLVALGRVGEAITLRIELAVRMMNEDSIWLARHLFESTFELTQGPGFTHKTADQQRRFQAEIYCLLAFLIHLDSEIMADAPISDAIQNLRECRELSKGEPWHFRADVFKMKFKKPIALHGIRNDEHVIEGNSVSLYMTASLLEHELLFELARQILFRYDNPLEDDVIEAIQHAYDALELALEVREPEVMSCALVRFGTILRDTGSFVEAMTFFEQLQMQAEMKSDKETEAISLYLQGTCYNGLLEPHNALEMFAHENEVGRRIHNHELQAEAAIEIGKTLLCEGQTVEAKHCFTRANEGYQKGANVFETPHRMLNDVWILDGISHGQNLWGRLAGLARRKTPTDIQSIAIHKLRRDYLLKVRRPNYDIDRSAVLFEEYKIMLSLASSESPQSGTTESEPTKPEGEGGDGRKDTIGGSTDTKTKKSRPSIDSSTDGKSGKRIIFQFQDPYQQMKAMRASTHLSELTETSRFTDSNSQSGSSTQSPQSLFDQDMLYDSDFGRGSSSTESDQILSALSNKASGTTGSASASGPHSRVQSTQSSGHSYHHHHHHQNQGPSQKTPFKEGMKIQLSLTMNRVQNNVVQPVAEKKEKNQEQLTQNEQPARKPEIDVTSTTNSLAEKTFQHKHHKWQT